MDPHTLGSILKSTLAVLCALLLAGAESSRDQPPVPDMRKPFFMHFVDHRSMPEKSLDIINMTTQDVGRSFALIAGVSDYPMMSEVEAAKKLVPAERDKELLINYLMNYEFFDEIVVLWDGDMNYENLTYFLADYFPRRLRTFPKSRFLFAYSGLLVTKQSQPNLGR